jgi:hypothetical protein
VFRAVHGLAGGLVALAILFGGASQAWAGAALTTVVDLPSSVAVGQTGVPLSVTLTNASTGAQATENFTVSSITMVATCGTQAILGGDCPLLALDLGVLRLGATGHGESGTACAGATFSIGLVDLLLGKYLFNPAAAVVLGPTGSPTGRCAIDFTLDVLNGVTKDSDPSTPGSQTVATASAIGAAADGLPAGGFGTATTTIVGSAAPVAPPLANAASAGDPGAAPAGATAAVTGHAAGLVSNAASTARCVVPKLKGKTLAGATHALRHGHCTVGQRHLRASHRVRPGRVIAQSRVPGRVLAAGAPVAITLSRSAG